MAFLLLNQGVLLIYFPSPGELTRESLLLTSVVAYLLGLFTPTIRSFFTSITGEVGKHIVRDRIQEQEEAEQWYIDVNSYGRQIVTQLYPESQYDDRLETTIAEMEKLARSPPDDIDPEYISLARELKNTYREGKRHRQRSDAGLSRTHESEVIRTALDLVLKTREEIDEQNPRPISGLIRNLV